MGDVRIAGKSLAAPEMSVLIIGGLEGGAAVSIAACFGFALTRVSPL